MQTVLMDSPRNMSYELPSTGLSPTWCTWFMPIRTGYTYDLAPVSSQVNNQASAMHIPAWQMTRICQDAQNHFWASPPLLEGTGIHIAPSPTGLTISSTAGPSAAGDMKWIAGGTTHLAGGVAVAADLCTSLGTTTGSSTPSATGILTSDVLSFSLASVVDPSGTWIRILPRFIVTAANTITWNGCNQGTASVTPVARDVNWYVARHVVTPTAARHKQPARRKQ